MIRRLISAAATASFLLTIGASAVFAGEITGNGDSLQIAPHKLHGASECAFSGQEDDQYLNPDGTKKAVVIRGEPAHAQSWGQIPKSGPFGRDFLTSVGANPGISCNPTKATDGPPA